MGLETVNWFSDFNIANPTDGDYLVEGDNHIRNIKKAILAQFTSLGNVAMTATAAELNKLAGLNTTKTELESLHNKTFTSSDDKIDNFPAGTLMLFQQTAAPTGWTKQVSHNDKALRIVSGTAGSGGSSAFTSAFAAGRAVSGTAISIAQMPAHDHGGGTHRHSLTMYPGADSAGVSVGSNNVRTNPQTMNAGDMGYSGTIISSQGSGASHDHTISIDVQYVDVIIASKD